jgi:hypothetical protein
MIMPVYILCRRFPGYHRDFPFAELVAYVSTAALLDRAMDLVLSLQRRAHEIEGEEGIPFDQAWTRAAAEWATNYRLDDGRRPRIFPHPRAWPYNDGVALLPEPGPQVAICRAEDKTVAERVVGMLNSAFKHDENNPQFACFDGRHARLSQCDLWDVSIAQLQGGETTIIEEPDAAICLRASAIARAAVTTLSSGQSVAPDELDPRYARALSQLRDATVQEPGLASAAPGAKHYRVALNLARRDGEEIAGQDTWLRYVREGLKHQRQASRPESSDARPR